MDMQWNRMLWWMGAVLLLACLLLSNRTKSQDITVIPQAAEAKKPMVVREKETQRPVPGAPDKAAFAAFMKKAESGDEPAKSVLGIMYALGVGVDRDSERGADFFISPDLQNNSRYLRSLCGMTRATTLHVSMVDDQGRFISEEEGERLTYEMLAGAEKDGDAGVQLALGIACANGIGVDRDFVKAAYWMTKAAEQNDALAQVLLGMMYETGMGVPRDKGESDRWYARSKAHPELTDKETEELISGLIEAVDEYLEKVQAVLLELAEKGDAEAQFRLGQFYEDVESDGNEQAAYAWYQKAAMQNHVKAQYTLGRIYEEGFDGVAPDQKEALKWYRRAASQRDVNAMKKVAELE